MSFPKEYQEFKPENVGETKVTITKGQFKGYVVLVRTAVSQLIFNGKYEPDNVTPIFTIAFHNSFIVIPPAIDVRRNMK